MARRYLSLVILIVIVNVSCERAVNAWQTDAIVALERGALDRWGRGDPGGYLDLYAPNVTYFDPMREKRLDGLAAMKQALEPIRGLVKTSHYELIAPNVYRSGDVAVLTYNLVSQGQGPDGKTVTARWNVTSVYGRIDGRWRIVHGHFSFTQPELKAPAP
jgi:uncharacterized protein (TIGR02246 family)